MSWAAIVKFFTDNPIARLIGAIILFLIGWEVVKRHLKEAGRQAERAAIAKKQAEVREAVNQRSSEIISEERNNADEAIRARDTTPSYPGSDSVRDDIARVIFRDQGSGKAD